MSMKDLIQQTLDMTQSERVKLASGASSKIMDWARNHGYNAAEVLVNYFKLFVSGDKNCDYRERDLFNRTFDMNVDSDQFYDITNHGANESFISSMVNMTNRMDSDTSSAVIILGLAVMCADGTMTVAEQQLLDRLM